MALTLEKGGSTSLAKAGESLSKLLVGLGWDENRSAGPDFDLDASAFGLRSGKVISEDWFVFYNQLQSPSNAIVHMGDNTTGAGDGDDEEILVDVSQMHPAIDTIAITVSIHKADVRRQNFGHVSNAYIRVVNELTGEEIVRYNLTDEASMETAVLIGELYKQDGAWNFRAVGKPYAGGLFEIATQFGIKF